MAGTVTEFSRATNGATSVASRNRGSRFQGGCAVQLEGAKTEQTLCL